MPRSISFALGLLLWGILLLPSSQACPGRSRSCRISTCRPRVCRPCPPRPRCPRPTRPQRPWNFPVLRGLARLISSIQIQIAVLPVAPPVFVAPPIPWVLPPAPPREPRAKRPPPRPRKPSLPPLPPNPPGGKEDPYDQDQDQDQFQDQEFGPDQNSIPSDKWIDEVQVQASFHGPVGTPLASPVPGKELGSLLGLVSLPLD